jgi:hypothetical protein
VDWVANIIVVFGAVSFLALGGYMAWGGDRTASATAVLTVACFLVLLLFVSKFKHVKGFGFEGELWEQEQVKAAELRKSLSAISESLSQQIALIASRVGYWNSTLSVEELLGVIDSNTEWLSTIGRNREKRDEILAPLYSKVEQYYWNDARELVAKTLSDQQNILQDKINRSPADPPAEREVLRRQLDAINAASERARKFYFGHLS